MSADSEGDRDMSTRFSFAPVGYFFVMNNLGVGGTVQFSRYAQSDYSSITFLIGPGARFYFRAGKLYPFVNASLSYGFSSWGDDNFDADDSCIQFTAGGGLGMMSFNVLITDEDRIVLNDTPSLCDTTIQNSPGYMSTTSLDTGHVMVAYRGNDTYLNTKVLEIGVDV